MSSISACEESDFPPPVFSSDVFFSEINTICCLHMQCFNPFYVVLLCYTAFSVCFVLEKCFLHIYTYVLKIFSHATKQTGGMRKRQPSFQLWSKLR